MIFRPSIVVSLLLAFGPASSEAADKVPDLDGVLQKDKIRPKGQWREASVPATLDLAQRAELSINVLTGNVEPAKFFGVYQGFQFNTNPPRRLALTWNITPKNVRTLPTLRVMTGNDFNLDVEYDMMRALLKEIRPDGQMYYPFDGEGPPQGTSYPQTNASMVLAMLNWYERDGNRGWLEYVDLLCHGLCKAAVQVEDRAYYPLQCGIAQDGSWHSMFRKGEKDPLGYDPAREPVLDQQGMEGGAKSDQVRCISALVKHYSLTGDTKSLEIARKVARFCLKPTMWEDSRAEGYRGDEHGIFGGHFHNNICAFMGLLDLAIVEKDDRLKQFVREGYEHACRNGVVRMGWFPSWTLPTKYNRPDILHNITEPCALADMVTLAVKLADAGLGDYWDDVDSIVRNHLVAQQIDDLDLMRKISGGGPQNDALLRPFLGGFAQGTPTAVENGFCTIPACCSANGARGFYYAWHGITRFDDGVATINLFLNRASPWVDIDSYLPYEGKVVIHNKKAHTLLVRIPRWLEPDQVQCFVNDKAARHSLAGQRQLLVQNLAPQDEIRLQFPISERTDRYTLHDKVYRVSFRASTVIDVQPRDGNPNDYPLYRRDSLREGPAPMQKVKRFVADKIIPLGPY